MRRLAFIGLLFVASEGRAAITFDASASSITAAIVSSTWTHTVGAGSNGILLYVGAMRTTAGNKVNAVTYGGATLTMSTTTNNLTRRCELWYLLNPTVGSASMVVTMSASPTSAAHGSVSLLGANQTAPEASNSSRFSTTGTTVTVVTIADNAWIIDTVEMGVAGITSITANSPQVERLNLNQTNGFFGGISTLGPVTPAGSTNMVWTETGGASPVEAQCGISLAPAVATAVVPILKGFITQGGETTIQGGKVTVQ